jgi:poly(A) polymerase
MTSVAHQDWFKQAGLKQVMELLNGNGGEARVVGGAVRNALMDMEISDVDIATTLTPDEVIARAKAASVKFVPTGYDHGTITLIVGGEPFEVTTLRQDIETDGRHAQVRFGKDWSEDAKRRDLTINALYVDVNGDVVDLVDGMKDIETRTVRFIGDATTRIAEDHLRILRFFRFFAFYGSGRPDADGLRASARAKDSISSLSAERVWSEMKKLLSAPDPSRALLWMRQAGVLNVVLPETEKWGIDAIHSLVETEKLLGWDVDPLLRLAAIIPPDAERVKELAKRLRLSRKEELYLRAWTEVSAIDSAIAGTVLDRLIYREGKDGVVLWLKLALASARASHDGSSETIVKVAGFSNLLARAEKFEAPSMPVSGADVIATGVQPGPEVGRVLSLVEDKWVNSNFSFGRDRLLSEIAQITQ